MDSTDLQNFSDRKSVIVEDKKNPSLVPSGDRKIPTLGSTVPVRDEALPLETTLFLDRLNLSG